MNESYPPIDELDELSFRSYAMFVQAKLMSSIFDLDKLMEISIDAFVELMRADVGFMLFNEKSQQLSVEAVKGLKSHTIRKGKINVDEDIIQWIIERKTPIFLSELEERLPIKILFQEMVEKVGGDIELSIPLVVKKNLVGLINLGRRESEAPFKKTDLQFLYTLADQVALAIENANLHQEKIEAEKLRIIEHKEAEETLKESEERYRTLFENSRDAVYITSRNGKFIDANQSAMDLFGYSREEMPEVKFQSFYADPNDRVRFIQEMEKKGSVKDFKVKLRKRDGTEMDCLITATVKWADDGRISGYQGIIRDVTERKRAEEALRREEEKFRVLVEGSPLGISLIGKDGDYKYINPRFIELFGYTLEEIPTGREWFRKAYPDKEYRNQVISIWFTDIKELIPGEFRPRTFTVTCKDGSEKVVRFLPVTMEKGDQFVIHEDITEQESLGAQLRQAQKMEAIGTLAGGVAHDFNNILTTIIVNAELSLMGLGKDNPLHEGIEEIKQAGERAASLTRQLLAFSRKQVLQPVVLNLNTVTNNLGKMLRRLIGEDVELETLLEPDLGEVEADPGQIEQVIMNLAVNARDAMPRGGKLTIETANVDLGVNYFHDHGVKNPPGPYVMLSVSDTGKGMDRETQSHIFEPFFTTKETGKGTGLGLSTVYGIIKQSNGFIWVYSEPGKGTAFKIYLPKVAGDAETDEKEKTSMDDLTGSETVLIVEDDDMLRNLAQEILELYGYTVLGAQDGEEALRVSEEHGGSIHMLLTDVVMPGISGRELAERLQSQRPEIKVIYMSGYTDNAIVRHGVLIPGVNFLEKPFSMDGLAKKVREVLDIEN